VALLENGIQLPDGNGGDENPRLELPERLKRFWISGDEVGEGTKKITIIWK